MSIGPVSSPSIPLRLAQAYGVAQAPAASPTGRAEPAGRIAPATSNSAPKARSEALNRLVGGVVPGKVDFSGSTPSQVDAPIPFYRRPGEANEVATAIRVGRTLDIEG